MRAAKRFVLVLLPPKQRQHMSVFAELAEVVAAGLQRLGYSTAMLEREFVEGERHNVFGPHLLHAKHAATIPASSILYNFEPLHPIRDIFSTFIDVFVPRFDIWDYSASNVGVLRSRARGSNIRHVPLGYVPALTRIKPNPRQDIDVFFYGALSPRRERVLGALRERGLNVVVATELYGSDRDVLIARAKVVLNVHYYDDARCFESPRIVYLLSNRKAVVTELHDGVTIDTDLKPLLVAARFDDLADSCAALVEDDARRRELEEEGFMGIQARDEAQILAAALRSVELETR
jgi:hypothetical protein